jgi:hypothetical protein
MSPATASAYEKIAVTATILAVSRTGHFDAAGGDAIFVDEIGDSLALSQAKLARVRHVVGPPARQHDNSTRYASGA